MYVQLTKTFEIDCAHHLPCFAPGHKCRQLHGHTMKIELVLEGEVPPGRDYLVDFGDIKAAFEPLREQLDHHLLNEIEGLAVPTVENMCKWIWDRLAPGLEHLSAVRVYETPQNRCEYRGDRQSTAWSR